MSLIQIGTTAEHKTVKLDLSTLVRTHLQIQGASGSGKSWLVRLLAEQLCGKIPVIIIDQEGEYATLREKYDYLLIGKGGEAPTTLQSAGLLSHRLLELRASAVIDLYDLDIPTRKLWIKKFFEGIMSAPKNLWRPTVFIIDEAHDFIPEKMESECAHILASAISKGRKRGFAFVCATQRLSKLNKDVASELQNVLIGKTWLDIDRERGASALGIYSRVDKEEFFEAVKRLEQGQFYAQGAAISLDRVLLRTGEVTTTHPDSSKVGHKTWLVPPPAPKAVKELLGKLGDIPKDAAEEAATISDLKHQIIQLKHELKVLPKTVAPSGPSPKGTHGLEHLQAKLKACQAEVETYKLTAKAAIQMLKKKNKQMASAAAALLEGTDVKIPELSEVKHALTPSIIRTPVPLSKSVSNTKKIYVAPVHNFQSSGGSDAAGTGDLSNKQLAILRALAQFESLGRSSVPRTWVAHLSGASHRSSAYANNVSNLRTRGLIEYAPDGLALTEAGRQVAPDCPAPLSTEEMFEACYKMTGNKQAAILKHLRDVYPESSTREDTAQNSGASVLSSAFANNVSALKSAGMIDYMPNRTLKAADWLFID